LAVEPGNPPIENMGKTVVPGDIRSLTFTVDSKNIPVSKRKLIKKEDYEIDIGAVDYKIMHESCNFVSVETGEDVFHVRKRPKKKDVEVPEKPGLVPADKTEPIFCEETREDNDSGVRSHFTCTDTIHVDVNSPPSRPATESQGVSDPSLESEGLDDRNPVCLEVVRTTKVLNQEHEDSVQGIPLGKDGHSNLVKKAIVKCYTPLATKKHGTSDAPVRHEKHGLSVQRKVRRYPKEGFREIAAKSEDTLMLDIYGPGRLSALKEQGSTLWDQSSEEQAVTIKTDHENECKSHRKSQDSTCTEDPISQSYKKVFSRTKNVKYKKSGKTNLAIHGIESAVLSKSSESAVKESEAVPCMKLKTVKHLIAKKESTPSDDFRNLEMKTQDSGKVAISDKLPAVPASVGCARCSITGWEWRTWARDRAKRRLQRRVKTAIKKEVNQAVKKIRKGTKKKETIVSNNISTAGIAGLQAARKNRADMRKLAVGAEGSDLLRFNMLKVARDETYISLSSLHRIDNFPVFV